MRARATIARSAAVAVLAVSTLGFGSAVPEPRSEPDVAGANWPYYHGGPHGTHYSRLDQITPANVAGLKVAWTYDTGDGHGEAWNQSDMQSNPLIVRERLFTVSPKGRLIALNAATGKELWTYDPAEGRPVRTKARSRGVSYWSDGREERILFTFGRSLIAVDVATGKAIPSFGTNGRVDLREGLGREPTTLSVSNVTPGAVHKDLLILGSTGATPGHVRAYDVRTGKIRWRFNTIPHPGEVGHDTWPADAWERSFGANVWAGMSVDPETGTVFLPTASGGMGDKDFYGADRHGDNLFANSVVALDAATGKRRWHFQTVRHDLWDRDLPAPPTLITVTRGGERIPALAQITKSGLVYVLDRRTGESLFPLETVAALPSDVPGERASPTQVRPTLPLPFARQGLTEDLLTDRTPAAREAALKHFRSVRSRGEYDPPSLQGTILFPGMDGGGEWGGAAFDPETGLLYVNANEMAWTLKLKPRPPRTGGGGGKALYADNCSSCHGENREGAGTEFPALTDVGDRLPPDEIAGIVKVGQGRMPSFNHLNDGEVWAIVEFLRTGRDESKPGAVAASAGPSRGDDAYAFDGYHRFLDPDGYPAVKPPWGTLNALDVSTGEWVWRVPFGEHPELAAAGLKDTGSENYGGAVVTKGGVLFIGATILDDKFRAFDKRTGRLLWETTLPAAGVATPATYLADGRQFVVIGAGGGKNAKKPAGGKIVAFALPR